MGAILLPPLEIGTNPIHQSIPPPCLKDLTIVLPTFVHLFHAFYTGSFNCATQAGLEKFLTTVTMAALLGF
jgi:hypothetical protein